MIIKMIDWKSRDLEVVGTAQNGGEVLRLIDELSPDIVITDIQMPGINGLEMIRQAVDRLSPRERRIITLRYGLYGCREKTQKEVADDLGISQSYISRLEKRILTRLRGDLAREIAG